jgi:hypothetical protein
MIYFRSWLAFLRKQRGAVSSAAITGLFVTGVLAFVLYIVIANFWPSAQIANASIQAISANDTGTSTTQTFFSLGLWMIPAMVFVALIVVLIGAIRHKR